MAHARWLGVMFMSSLLACGGNDDDGLDPIVVDDATPADGTDGDGASNDGAVTETGSPCPSYHALCGTTCVYVGNDPKNCGGCGVTCPAGQVCSAGGCSDTCMPGLEACAGSCVDRKTDNDNCGSCGTKCTAPNACVDGSCKPATVYPAPPKCAGGSGPAIVIDSVPKAPCSGDLAATTFTWALCSCQDILLSGKVLIDGFDSSKGPYKPGELGGGVGANGFVKASSDTDVYGQLWAASKTLGIEGSSRAVVHHDLRCGGPLVAGDTSARRDAYVSGNIKGKLVVGSTLFQSPGALRDGDITYKTLDTSAAVTVAPPCSCTSKVPVAAIVAAGKAKNDNAAVGLDADALNKVGHPDRIDLPCGHYYLKGFTLSAATAIVVHGRTAIYVDGDIETGGTLSITLDAKSELDLFISGTIRGSADFRVGSANYPALTRIYVGGTETLRLTSNILIAGNLWAGNAKVLWTSDAQVFGSVFGGDFEATAPVQIHYDRHVVTKGGDCPKLPPTVDAGTPETSVPTTCGVEKRACGSCSDCSNQACAKDGTCGSCTSNADCCAPLVCQLGCCISPIK